MGLCSGVPRYAFSNGRQAWVHLGAILIPGVRWPDKRYHVGQLPFGPDFAAFLASEALARTIAAIASKILDENRRVDLLVRGLLAEAPSKATLRAGLEQRPLSPAAIRPCPHRAHVTTSCTDGAMPSTPSRRP